jgi:hypothetical protein
MVVRTKMKAWKRFRTPAVIHGELAIRWSAL